MAKHHFNKGVCILCAMEDWYPGADQPCNFVAAVQAERMRQHRVRAKAKREATNG
jgi:hypothetical protein